MQKRLTLITIGLLLLLLGGAMLIPALIEYLAGEPNFKAFAKSGFLCFFVGGILYLTNQGGHKKFTLKEGFLLTSTSWLVLSLAGALPLWMADMNLSFTDAYFEGLSGITTTGSTILSGLDTLSPGVLLWRSILQWIGGIGIIAFGIFLLPYLQIGGMQLFKTESSDRSDKALPRSKKLIGGLVLVYIGLSILCFFSYFLLGMTGFEAVNHAMTTLSTGGYSTHDASFGYYESTSLQLTATLFMLLGGLPFVLYVKLIHSKNFAFHTDEQVKGFLAVIAVISITIILYLLFNGLAGPGEAFVKTLFNVISILTTTGYATTDYTLWGPFVTAVFFFITYMGGCAGSTSGGLKTMRLLVVLKATKAQINRLLYPHGVYRPKYQNKLLDKGTVNTVMGFLALYVLLNVFLTLALSLTGLDTQTAFSGAATAIANVGPGIGEIIGPAGNFSTLPDAAKWLLCLGMFLGRLEILTVLVLFHPLFWRFP